MRAGAEGAAAGCVAACWVAAEWVAAEWVAALLACGYPARDGLRRARDHGGAGHGAEKAGAATPAPEPPPHTSTPPESSAWSARTTSSDGTRSCASSVPPHSRTASANAVAQRFSQITISVLVSLSSRSAIP